MVWSVEQRDELVLCDGWEMSARDTDDGDTRVSSSDITSVLTACELMGLNCCLHLVFRITERKAVTTTQHVVLYLNFVSASGNYQIQLCQCYWIDCCLCFRPVVVRVTLDFNFYLIPSFPIWVSHVKFDLILFSHINFSFFQFFSSSFTYFREIRCLLEENNECLVKVVRRMCESGVRSGEVGI